MSGVSAFLWQAAALLLVAYFLGAWMGCLLRRLLSVPPTVAMEAADSPRNAAASADGAITAAGIVGAGATGAAVAVDPAADRFSRALDGVAPDQAAQPPDKTETATPLVAPEQPTTPTADAPASPEDAVATTEDAVATMEDAPALASNARPARDAPSIASKMQTLETPDPLQEPEAPDTSDSDNSKSNDVSSAELPPSAATVTTQPAEAAPNEAAEEPNAPSTPEPVAKSQPTNRADPAPVDTPRDETREGITPADTLAMAGTAALGGIVAAQVVAAPEDGSDTVEPTNHAADPNPSIGTAAATEPDDELTRIDGLTSGDAQKLNGLGVSSFAAIAAWHAADIRSVGAQLGGTKRIQQENWIEQAALLARDGQTEHTRRRVEPTAKPPAERAQPDPTPQSTPVPPPANGKAEVSGRAPRGSARTYRDNLQEIDGINDVVERSLNQQGVTRLRQIASWDGTDVRRFDRIFGATNRVRRENWVGQAQRLTGQPEVEPPTPPVDKIGKVAAITSPQDQEVAADHKEVSLDETAHAAQSQPDANERPDIQRLRSVRSEALVGGANASPGASGDGDDLKRIRGVGVLIEKRLKAMGYKSYEGIAAWSQADVDRVNQKLDFRGRIERENWIQQARILAAGGQTEFSRRNDKSD